MRQRGERGASAVEYALLVVALAVVMIAAAVALQGVTRAGFKANACDESNGMSCCGTAPDIPACPEPSAVTTP